MIRPACVHNLVFFGIDTCDLVSPEGFIDQLSGSFDL
jgi:hypothetical protein